MTKGIKCVSCWFFIIQYYLPYPLTQFQSNSILPILFLIFFNRHVPVTRPSHDVTRVTKGIKCVSCWFFVIQYYLPYPLTHFQSNSILPILFLIFFNRHVPVTRPSHDVTRVTKGIKCISCRFFVIQWYLPYPLTHPQNYNTLHILFHTFF